MFSKYSKKSIPMVEQANLAALISVLDRFISNFDQCKTLLTPLISMKVITQELKFWITDAACGTEFAKILDAWKKKYIAEYRNYNNRANFFNKLKIHIPTVVNHEFIKEFCDALHKRFGKINIYPQLLDVAPPHHLFKNGATINTEVAISLVKTAGFIAAEAKSSDVDPNETYMNQISACEIFDVLKEMIDPVLYDLCSQDPNAWTRLLIHSRSWDAYSELTEKLYIDNDERYCELNMCAQMQQYLLNSLPYIMGNNHQAARENFNYLNYR